MSTIKQVVYVDVLFALNMIISFFLISAAKRICRQRINTWRVLFGAVAGGVYSLAIFLPQIHTLLSLACRAVFMLLLTAVVFGFGSIRRFFRCFASLFVVSFVLSGALMAVWVLFKPQALLIKNGSVYFDIGFLSLVLSAAALYAAVWLFKRFISPKSDETAECEVLIKYGERFVKTKGIIDTGNTLMDSFTGKKVSVADKSTALALLPFDAAECVERRNFEKLPPYMHLTVSHTVGGEGLLPVFETDLLKITVKERTVEIKNAAVAVSEVDAFRNFGILINSQLIGEDELDKKTDTKNKTAFSEKEKQVGLLHKRSADSAAASDRRR